MRTCVAAVAACLWCGIGLGNAMQQRLVALLGARANSVLVIPPQLLMHLRQDSPHDLAAVMQLLRQEQEQHIQAQLPIDGAARPWRELLRQAVQQAQAEAIAEFDKMLSDNVWEALSLFSLTHSISGDVQFFLDTHYGTETLLSNASFSSVNGLSFVSAQQRLVLDFSSITAVDVEQDFFTLPALPPPVFAQRHIVFHGEHYVYVLNRETLALEHVSHSETKIDDHLSFANKVHRIDLVNPSLISVRYHKAQRREFVQLIDLNSLTTVNAREIEGELRAVNAQGTQLAVQHSHHLEVINLVSGSKHLFPSRDTGSVSFADGGKRLAFIDGDVLNLIDLTHSPQIIPQRIALAPMQKLIETTPPANKLLYDGNELYSMHRAVLTRINGTGELVWQQQLPDDMHTLQEIDAQHLALFSEQEVQLFNKEDGSRVLRLAVPKQQRLADHAYADRYLSLLLEDRMHLGAFSLTLARVPLAQLLQLLNDVPLLREIAAQENFTLPRGRARFAALVISAVERHLQHHQISTHSLVHLLRRLYQAYHLVPGSYYAASNIATQLHSNAEEVAQLSADDPRLAELLRSGFF